MKTIEIQDIPEIIEASLNSSINLLFLGDTGIGKTKVINDYAKENGYTIQTLILSQLEASEALGIPLESQTEFNGKTYKSLETAVPEWVFKLAKAEKAILFLDEFLTAPPNIMNSFLNFLSEKQVNGIDLSHVRIIAATNIEEYTFKPSNNIRSRFCMFYSINTKYNEYIGDPRIKNDYKDTTEIAGELFEEFSLKPRCQAQLADISDKYLDVFYQGFTNKALLPVFSPNEKIDEIIKSVVGLQFEEEYKISDSMIPVLSIMLVKEFPRVKNWGPKVSTIANISLDKRKLIDKLEKEIKLELE